MLTGDFRASTARDLIAREMAALDECRWDDWLALYSPDCEFWMPMWRDEEALTSDPLKELSHIYYRSRAGLEDRVLRIKTRTASSSPLPRTVHAAGWVLVEPESTDARLLVRNAWSCNVFLPSARESTLVYGISRYEFERTDKTWAIQRRKIQLQNDYIGTMLDINCL